MTDCVRNKRGVLFMALVMISAVTAGFVAKKGGEAHSWTFSEANPYSVIGGTAAEPAPEVFKNSPRLLYARYKVSENKSIQALAMDFGTDARTLKSSNLINSPSVKSGAVLNILNRSGLLYETSEKDTLASVAGHYRPADRTVKEFAAEIVQENELPPSALLVGYSFQKGEKILLPGVFAPAAKVFVPHKKSVAANTASKNQKLYVIPVSYKRISSYFGWREHPKKHKKILHKGCDLQAPYGTPVYAARSGTVTSAKWERGYGNTVEILHADGYSTRYAHLSSINVKKGDAVKQGASKIGEVGRSGMATGNHLHFELVTPKGKCIDPLAQVKK